MATKARLHWFWRAAIAALAGLVVQSICWSVSQTVPMLQKSWANLVAILYPHVGMDSAWEAGNLVFLGLPTVVTVLLFRWLLDRWLGDNRAYGELHCRRCHHILRGLSAPRCPECGEAI